MSYLSYIKNDKLNNSKFKKESKVPSKLSSNLNLTRNKNIDLCLEISTTLQKKNVHHRINSFSPIEKILEKKELEIPDQFNLMDPPTSKNKLQVNNKFKLISSLNTTQVDINTNAKFAVVDLNSNPYINENKHSGIEDYYSTTYSQISTQANSMGMKKFSQGKLPNFKMNVNKVTASFMKSFQAPENMNEMTQTNTEIFSKHTTILKEGSKVLPDIKSAPSSSPKTKKKQPSMFDLESQPKLYDNHTLDPEEVEFVYNKVFDKKFEYLINPKVTKKVTKVDLQNPEYKNKKKKKFIRTTYLEDKIKQIKQKIFFMKGIFDYSYPQILVGRIKICNSFLNKKEKEDAINNLKKNADDRYEVHKSHPRFQKIRESMVVDNLKEMNTSRCRKEGEEEQAEANEKNEKLKMMMTGDMRQYIHKNGSLKKIRLSLENGKVISSSQSFKSKNGK